MFHTTGQGQIAPCGASVRSCPLAPVEDHFNSVREATRALALEALERQSDYVLSVPAGWGQVVLEDRTPAAKPTAGVAASSLSVDDFLAFKNSAANSAKPVDDDWREKIARSAELNGDAHADAHANTTVSGYWDATPEDDDDLSMFEPF